MDIEYGTINSGSQFPSMSAGQTFTVKILINSGSQALKAFQVIVYFNPDVLRVESDSDVTRGSDWSLGDFAPTANAPIEEVQVIGSNSDATRSGTLQVAEIQFTVQSNRPVDQTSITGLIVATDAGPNGDLLGANNRAVVAGAGEMWAQGRRGRQLLPATGHADPAYSSVVVHTRRALFDVHPKSLTV